jgi:hypothetical protein
MAFTDSSMTSGIALLHVLDVGDLVGESDFATSNKIHIETAIEAQQYYALTI